MNCNPKNPHRKNLRLKEYDYSKNGMYYITICTQNRECILSKIIEYEENNVKPVGVGVLDDPKIENIKIKLLKPGEFIKKQIQLMNRLYKDIKIIDYVIMPNHIHFILILKNNNVINLKDFITTYKSTVTKKINKIETIKIWQRNYYEHIIRNEKELYAIIEYIQNNPINWRKDSLNI